ncbi:NADH:ubiquinone reductase (Na(+)-transporting) subunit C [Portibacter lacus]|uniref:Na(+)-translocating NADH-quinone reductase subunit C n=1 Tax=Portibacter lacus TaxID=1099794 RepID=A0AA37STW8_9BACT|nr:NADH:ubiquinone reductase (Na(+)-transporting) subunit C [Portibacter lacus]GLR19210.1 Na(+)-translocating NADH-quinone reductase subunit C [Portibacter lacus]
MHSTAYITRFVLIMTTIVAMVLAFLSFGLKPIHKKNEAVYNKKAILSAIADQLEGDYTKMTDDEVQGIFDKNITQEVINMEGTVLGSEDVIAAGYPGGRAEDIDMRKEKKKSDEDRIFPIYTYTKADGEKLYILSVVGNGLWDAIWGNIALKSDKNTIAGVAFDHAGETPGLGAEIKDNQAWVDQFKGKSIYDEQGNFVSVDVKKAGGTKNLPHAVDGITGATITADGVDAMLEDGLEFYEPFLKKNN